MMMMTWECQENSYEEGVHLAHCALGSRVVSASMLIRLSLTKLPVPADVDPVFATVVFILYTVDVYWFLAS